ncbi:hypothetical protein LR48_Vigan10g200500 [Vigna angularis]|nr:hypothetical protein LR48_Vigan10g200500 [Vigna angularis]
MPILLYGVLQIRLLADNFLEKVLLHRLVADPMSIGLPHPATPLQTTQDCAIASVNWWNRSICLELRHRLVEYPKHILTHTFWRSHLTYCASSFFRFCCAFPPSTAFSL